MAWREYIAYRQFWFIRQPASHHVAAAGRNRWYNAGPANSVISTGFGLDHYISLNVLITYTGRRRWCEILLATCRNGLAARISRTGSTA